MARAFVFPYTDMRVDELTKMAMLMPVKYVADDGVTSYGATLEVVVPLEATPQQIRTATLSATVAQGAFYGVAIGQNDTLLFGFDKG